MNSFTQWLTQAASDRDTAGLTRRLVVHKSRNLIDLAGNDYLGLRRDERVLSASIAAAEEFGAGAGASRLVTGTWRVHEELERAIASLTGAATALAFSTGYHANLGVLTALADRDTLIISDAHNHASIVDAARLARGTVQVVPHKDVQAVAHALAGRTQPRALVVVESIFSVLGDQAPLLELLDLVERHDALLMVDEAHAIGVIGDRGEGMLGSLGMADHERVVATTSLSKSLAAQGGAFFGSHIVREHLVNTARPFIYDTGLAPASAGAAIGALEVLAQEPDLVKRVQIAADRLATACEVAHPDGAVLSVPMASPHAALAAVDVCAAHGIRIGCFRPPSTPDGISRLRLTAHANLSETDLDFCAAALREVVRRSRHD
ncbi:8-amino-7-oxononanoate synthase [Leekyejoonella antrihumi]|uniref:8-amino-7-oxononanoate synthase n=1 Tax=Leekyejoonella antrihumi TaxID=1660198 RepID=A0A563E7V1_9MICO|nr:8-amino-7-oxononanoate synthase [Leekyejoonella antrihumi]TWP37904.1 8-amino-7-oxononanoate synthase [Leekyejoonella antrihumi]